MFRRNKIFLISQLFKRIMRIVVELYPLHTASNQNHIYPSFAAGNDTFSALQRSE